MQFIKSLFVVAIILFSTLLSAQVEVTSGTFPFSDVVEWEGQGALFLGNDPSGKSQEINFNLFNNKGEVAWNRSVYPKAPTTHLIVSGRSNYIYFVDDLAPVNNQIRYNQVSQSGNVISTKFEVLSILRKYGYTNPNDLDLKNIVNTPKALVFYFQLPIKVKGIIENIFITITHHNNRTYYCKAPVVDMAKKKEEQEVYTFSGATEEEIQFSKFNLASSSQKVNLFTFSPKAEIIDSSAVAPKGLNPLFSTISTSDLDGAYYLLSDNKSFSTSSYGYGITFQDKYYYFANDAKDLSLKIYGQNEKGDFVQLNENKRLSDSKKAPYSEISFFQKDNALFIVSQIDKNSIQYKIENGKIQVADIQPSSFPVLTKNPSSYKVNQNNDKFVHYINGIPYYLNGTNLKKQDNIIFKKL